MMKNSKNGDKSQYTKGAAARTEFVQMIVEARKKSGMSQRELARKWNVSNASWARWESEKITSVNIMFAEVIFLLENFLSSPLFLFFNL